MRYLNKIVFLNSAHIPYSEIQLDGNVHFIGTQGVGKSTLLRAILFFYNADKLRLGIPKEKRSYDEFYLPYANSFIVYEVMRENGPYCVMAFKQQGRVAYRFIDAPYQRHGSSTSVVRFVLIGSLFAKPLAQRRKSVVSSFLIKSSGILFSATIVVPIS